MKKKYLYNGQIIDEADVMDAAKQSNLDINAYIQKAGMKAIDDSYSYQGKDVSAEDILDAANQSKLGFDDYIQKAGFQKKSQNGNGLPVGQPKPSPTELPSQGDNYPPPPQDVDLSGKRPAAYPLLNQQKSGFKLKINLGEPQPTKEVSTTEFLAHEMGLNEADFAPHKIYNNASKFILDDLAKHPMVFNAPYPEKLKEQIIKGDGGINIQSYVKIREDDISKQQQDLSEKIAGESFTGASNTEKINGYKKQIAELENQKNDLKLNASEINDVQSVTQTPPPKDPSKKTDYFREIGRNVHRLSDPVGVANQEKNIKEGTNGARDKELVDTENYANEQAGIEAKEKQLDIGLGNGVISKEDYDNQMDDIKTAKTKLLSNNPGAKAVMDRNAISKIIEETRNNREEPGLQGFGAGGATVPANNLFNDIISYTPSAKEVKEAIATAREQGYAISPEEEKKYISDREQIPGTSALGNLFNSSIVSTATSINNFNPFLSKQEIEGEKYRIGKLFEPVQRQTKGVLGYVNQTANLVGTVAKWATLGKFLGGGANVLMGSAVGAETIGGVSETLGGIRTLTAAQSNLIGTMGTAGLLIYPEAKEEASKFTTNESKQEAYAATMTLLNTLAFTALNPHGIINKILGNVEAKSEFTKEFLKTINNEGGFKNLTKEAFKQPLINFAKNALGANASATATMTALNFAEQATDVMFDKKPHIDMNEVGKNMLDNFITFAPLSIMQGAMGAYQDKKQRDITIQLVNQAAKDPIAFKIAMDNAVDEGKISRDEANKKIQIVNTNASLRQTGQIPSHLSEENKAIYADNMRRELVLQKEVKESVDPIQIKAKNEEIKDLQERRKSILDPLADPSIKTAIENADNIKNQPIIKPVFKSGDPEAIRDALDYVSGQWHDEGTRAQTERDFGLPIVEAAKKLFPKESQPSLSVPEAIPNRNDDFVNKYFPEGSTEKTQFDKLDEEGQSKMIADKREELKKFATPEKESTVVGNNKNLTNEEAELVRQADISAISKMEDGKGYVGGYDFFGKSPKEIEKAISKSGLYSPESLMESYKDGTLSDAAKNKIDEIIKSKQASKPITNKEVTPEEYRTDAEADKILKEKILWAKKYNTNVDYKDIVTGEEKTAKTHKAIDEMSKRYKSLRELIVNCL